MNRQLIIAVLSVVLVAGCIGQPEGGVTTPTFSKGLEVTDFTIQPEDSIRSGSSLFITMGLANQGSNPVDQTTGYARLIIPSDWKKSDGSAVLSETERVQEYKRTFQSADPAVGRLGDISTVKWSVKAPPLSRGQTRTDNIITRLYYDYKTDANGKIYIYPLGEEIIEKSSFVSDISPINLEVRSIPETPIIETISDSFIVEVKITNIGTGRVYKNGVVTNTANDDDIYPTPGEDTYNKVTLTLASIATGITVGDGCTNNVIELFGKPETATVLCDITIAAVPGTKTPISFIATATFGYHTEQKKSITITGKDQPTITTTTTTTPPGGGTE